MVEQEDEEVHVGPIDLYAENERTCSVSTMQRFKSALLWSYWKAKVPFPVETNVWLDNFVLAYKKIVAEKKLLGIRTSMKANSQFLLVATMNSVKWL